jgi:hypothetical protein
MVTGTGFALPTIPSSGMTRDDQGSLIVNQAIAIMVAAYVDYLKTVVQVTNTPVANFNHDSISQWINDWQDALKSF